MKSIVKSPFFAQTIKFHCLSTSNANWLPSLLILVTRLLDLNIVFHVALILLHISLSRVTDEVSFFVDYSLAKLILSRMEGIHIL